MDKPFYKLFINIFYESMIDAYTVKSTQVHMYIVFRGRSCCSVRPTHSNFFIENFHIILPFFFLNAIERVFTQISFLIPQFWFKYETIHNFLQILHTCTYSRKWCFFFYMYLNAHVSFCSLSVSKTKINMF